MDYTIHRKERVSNVKLNTWRNFYFFNKNIWGVGEGEIKNYLVVFEKKILLFFYWKK
jgi:hypothetical protein